MESLKQDHPLQLSGHTPYSSIVERMGIERKPVPVFSRNSAPAASYRELWKEVGQRLGLLKEPAAGEGKADADASMPETSTADGTSIANQSAQPSDKPDVSIGSKARAARSSTAKSSGKPSDKSSGKSSGKAGARRSKKGGNLGD